MKINPRHLYAFAVQWLPQRRYAKQNWYSSFIRLDSAGVRSNMTFWGAIDEALGLIGEDERLVKMFRIREEKRQWEMLLVCAAGIWAGRNRHILQ